MPRRSLPACGLLAARGCPTSNTAAQQIYQQLLPERDRNVQHSAGGIGRVYQHDEQGRLRSERLLWLGNSLLSMQ